MDANARVLLAICLWALPAVAQSPDWSDGFDAPAVSWSPLGGDAQYRLARHERSAEAAYRGLRGERIEIVAGPGTTAYFAHEISPALVIEELVPTLWLRADRPGVQLLARIVYPAALDPRTGQPLTSLASGESYSQVGAWQALSVRSLPLLAARQARYLRAKQGVEIDARGAYVDALVVNVYGGPGATRVSLDELRVTGAVARTQIAPVNWNQAAAPETPPPSVGVELSNGVLLAGGRPLFPRAVEHRGEPLAFLKQLGFNAVVLSSPPTGPQLRDAARLELWLVAPPPVEIVAAAKDARQATAQPVNLRPSEPRPTRLPEISAAYDPVLAWQLGEKLSTAELEATKALSATLRQSDRRRRRPLVAEAETHLVQYSRYVDYLLVRREPLGSSLELGDYLTWLVERPKLARPGSLAWASVQTEHAPGLVDQLRRFGDSRQPLPTIDAERIRLMAMAAVAGGHRGVLFRSSARLDGVDPATRKRAAAVELANLDLQLLEPWGTSGVTVAMADASDKSIRAAVMTTPRATLVLPLWTGPAAQCVPGQAASSNLTIVVPGAPESHSAYEISPGGFQKLWHKRVAGGLRVTIEEFGLGSIVLLTQDASAVAGLTSRLGNVQQRAAGLARDLAVSRQFTVEQIDRRLKLIGRGVPEAERWLQQSRTALDQADRQMASGNWAGAYLEAERSLRPLRMLERAHWESATRGVTSPCVSPLIVSFETLPWHYALADTLRGAQVSPNLLTGGDFENPQQLMSAGWKNLKHEVPGIDGQSTFVAEGPHAGRSCLKLTSRAADTQAVFRLLESAPLWVSTPEVRVGPGQLVRIRGFLKIDRPIDATVDGLSIIDSLGGESLAWRAGKTSGWQEFVMYRAAGDRGAVQVTFALTGLGEALIDDVTIETVQGLTWPR